MSYIEAELVIEGALTDYKIFESEGELEEWIDELRTDYSTIHAETTWQVFTIHHPHSYHGQECECEQYEQNHQPEFKIPAD